MMRDDETPESSSISDADPIDRPGQRLAEARERQGRSRAEIAAALKLPRSIIEAIEEDRMDRIAPIYRRGYLLNYARELGEPVADYRRAEIDTPPPLKGVLPVAPQPRVDRYLRYASYFLGTTLIVPPLVYFFIAGGTRLFDDASEATVGVDTDTAVVAPSDDPSAVSSRIARALALDDADARMDASDGPLAASTLPLPTLRPAESLDVSAEHDGSLGPVAGDASAGRPSPLHRISLVLVDDSWVEISDADGARLEFDLLRAGAERSYEGLPPFRVLFGRASAVQVELDGQPVRFEGSDSASIAEFTLQPPAAADDRAAVAESDTP
ncbi:DUF4115 domain-containing protein [Wenzhouxiangella sp. XN79A]|uniref:helix-turn-helix domain-containing protein n=1 Tax=Wenzhouxiangella sp. XN79A TaxID=2724193 RepID=UPI00144A82F8|nr:RodZ domain-containing protein [Wenzhouxiangella sp. XN79A]NKI34554.1 DUF4115 domain-containing protein [Wenzhouxiangella sp. XN79A]